MSVATTFDSSIPASALTSSLKSHQISSEKMRSPTRGPKLIGYYGDDKRFGAVFEEIVAKKYHRLVRIDPTLTLDQQSEVHGRHFDLIIHKMTKEIAMRGRCAKSNAMLSHLEEYRRRHPGRCLVLDPPESIACTTDRVALHHKLQALRITHKNEVVLYPHSVVLGSSNDENNSRFAPRSFGRLSTSGSCNSSSYIFASPQPSSHSSNHRQLNGSSPEDDIRALLRLQEEGFRFPAIAKPGNADGSPASHEMALVFNAGGLRPVQRKMTKDNNGDSSIVLQQFINHDGVLHKIYCLGDKVFMGVRPSLPNLNRKLKKLRKKIMKMQKNKPNPSEEPKSLDEDSEDEDNYQYFGRISKDEDPAVIPQRLPSKKLVAQLCSHLRCTLGMNLFGLDLITKSAEPGDEGHLEHYVIDVNYFPSYVGMPDVAESFCEYVDACVETSTLFPFSTTNR